jgi:hypothetical protein
MDLNVEGFGRSVAGRWNRRGTVCGEVCGTASHSTRYNVACNPRASRYSGWKMLRTPEDEHRHEILQVFMAVGWAKKELARHRVQRRVQSARFAVQVAPPLRRSDPSSMSREFLLGPSSTPVRCRKSSTRSATSARSSTTGGRCSGLPRTSCGTASHSTRYNVACNPRASRYRSLHRFDVQIHPRCRASSFLAHPTAINTVPPAGDAPPETRPSRPGRPRSPRKGPHL